MLAARNTSSKRLIESTSGGAIDYRSDAQRNVKYLERRPAILRDYLNCNRNSSFIVIMSLRRLTYASSLYLLRVVSERYLEDTGKRQLVDVLDNAAVRLSWYQMLSAMKVSLERKGASK